jgi:hypothetical protein
MMKKSVLFINSRKPQPVRMFEEDENIELTVITEPAYVHYYSPDITVIRVADLTDFTTLRDLVAELLTRQAIEYVVSPSEKSLQVGGFIRSYFGIPGIGYETANAFSNKRVMKDMLRSAGVPVADYQPIQDPSFLPEIGDKLGWPIVVKPVIGSGATGVVPVMSRSDAAKLASRESWFQRWEKGVPCIAEKYLDIDAEYHCNGIVSKGRTVFTCVAQYFIPPLKRNGNVGGSYVLPNDTPLAARILNLHDRAVRALGLVDGVTHLEVLRTRDELIAGEITCRPGGGGIPEMIKMHYNVDIWDVFRDLSLGGEPLLEPTGSRDCTGYFLMPAPAGVVSYMTGPEELMAVPGVERVDYLVSRGDCIPEERYSSQASAVIYARSATVSGMKSLRSTVARKYAFRTY